jgi:hypothetical protein
VICARCHECIKPDEPYESRDIESASGPGATVFLHKHLCKRPPTHTAPVGLGR